MISKQSFINQKILNRLRGRKAVQAGCRVLAQFAPYWYLLAVGQVNGQEPGAPPPANRQLAAELQDLVAQLPNNAMCVQIGSNDGLNGDPLHDLIVRNTAWRGLFVEPMPTLFAQLQQNYGRHSPLKDGEPARLRYANCAVGESHGLQPFYFVHDRIVDDLGKVLPFWWNQIGSFDRNHISKHAHGVFEPYIDSMDVACVSLLELLEEHDIERVDLIHVDVEGFDYQVVNQIPLVGTLAPKVVLFERCHMPQNLRDDLQAKFKQAGYTIKDIGADTLAYRL